MKDSFGRTIDYLRLSVTDRCNLRCRYCMPEEGVPACRHDEILSYEELERIARVAISSGIRRIRITGGEPLVRRGLPDFIARLADISPRPELSLTTNGLLLAEQAQRLKQAGLDRINVSLDTLQPERFREMCRRDGLAQVFAGLDAAEQVGLAPIKVNMVPLAGFNVDEIGEFARLTLKRNCDIRFIEFMPVSGGLDYPAESRVPTDEIRRHVELLGPLEEVPSSGSGPARTYQLPGARGRIGFISAISEHFCDRCNRLRLTPEGQVRPCLFSDMSIDLRTPLRAGASDSILRELLQQAICGKPEKHAINSPDFHPGSRRMNTIGG